MRRGPFSSRGRVALGILGALLLAAPAAANATAPIIPSTSASEVTETSALLQGAVAPKQSTAEAHFEYVDQASYEASGFASASKTETLKVPLTVKGKGDLVGPVEATGDLTAGSAVVTNLNVTSGSFSSGQNITGEGIPSGTSIKSVGPGTLTLSTPVEAGKSKTEVALTGVASSNVTGLIPESGTFVPGQTISAKNGKGIKSGTSILAVSGNSLTLSQPTTETIHAAELTASTTFAQGSGDIQEGSSQILHVTLSAGTFVPGQVLTGAGIRSETAIRAIFPDSEPGKLRLEISRNATAGVAGVALVAAAPQPISASISGLSPQTQYHLRVAATDSQGNEATGPEVVFFTLAPSPTFPECSNDIFRSGELSAFGFPSAHLPDCRSYEQATPINKDGGDVQSFLPYAKAGADGNSVVFGTTFGAPNAEGAQQLPFFLAQRGAGASGWSSRGLLPPASLGEKGNALRGWTPDFSSTFASVIRLDNPLTEALYELHSDGSPPRQVAPYAQLDVGNRIPYNWAGASANGSTVFFESHADLLAGAGPPYPLLKADHENLYAWNRGTNTLTLAGRMNSSADTEALLPKGTHTGPYDWMRGRLDLGNAEMGYYLDAEHAISDDGSVFFTSASDGQLYQRLNPTATQSAMDGDHCIEPAKACTIHISATQKTNGGPDQDGPDPAGPQPAAFMAASSDGKTAYFTSSEKLTNDANTGPEQPPAQIGTANLGDPDPDATKDEGLIPTHALGVAIDPNGEYIYWADPTRGTIGRAKLTPDGSGIEGPPQPSFIDPGETRAITLPKSEPGVYHSAPSRPRYLAVDDEYIYWTNTGPDAVETTNGFPGKPIDNGGTIGRARIDGSGPEPVQPEFITGASNPQGIAVNASHIYWANAGYASNDTIAIARATIEGSDVKQVFIKTGTATPSGVALNPTYVYYSSEVDSNGSAFINRFRLDGTEEEFAFIGTNPDLRGVAVDAGHIYWTSSATRAVGRADLDLTPASKENEFIKLNGQPAGLALVGAHLFYSTSGESASNPGNDLYRFEAPGSPNCQAVDGCLSDLTPVSAGNGAEVVGVLGASDDGSIVYFIANRAPGDPGEAEAGKCTRPLASAASGARCSLYVWHDGEVTFIAPMTGTLQGDDLLNIVHAPRELLGTSNYIEKTSFLSTDGRALLFLSAKKLTSYDNNGTPEYYLYRLGQAPLCVTCAPTGAAPSDRPLLNSLEYPGLGPLAEGVASVQARHLSADGTRVFFQTTERLVAEDTNGIDGCPVVPSNPAVHSCEDVYEWEAPGSGTCTEHGPAFSELNQGCIYLISTGKSAYPSFFIDASESGDDVFFLTRDSLVGSDGDSIQDVYDARVNGGLVSQNAKPRPPCEVEGCLPGATPPPPIPAPPNITGPPDPKPKRCKSKKCRKQGHRKHGHKRKHPHHTRKAGRR